MTGKQLGMLTFELFKFVNAWRTKTLDPVPDANIEKIFDNVLTVQHNLKPDDYLMYRVRCNYVELRRGNLVFEDTSGFSHCIKATECIMYDFTNAKPIQ